MTLEKPLQNYTVQGRIDEQGRVLLPVTVIAADGVELELEAIVSLDFGGSMALADEVARRLGWRRLGARRVIVGFETVLMDHYLGTMALGKEPSQAVVLGGINRPAVIGHSFSGRRLTVDFVHSSVVLE